MLSGPPWSWTTWAIGTAIAPVACPSPSAMNSQPTAFRGWCQAITPPQAANDITHQPVGDHEPVERVVERHVRDHREDDRCRDLGQCEARQESSDAAARHLLIVGAGGSR